MNSLTTTLYISHGRAGSEKSDAFFAHEIILEKKFLHLEFYYPPQLLEKILKKKNIECMADVFLNKRQFWLKLELHNYMQTAEKDIVSKYKLSFKISDADVTYKELFTFYQRSKFGKNMRRFLLPIFIPLGMLLGYLIKDNPQYKIKIDSGFKKIRQIEISLKEDFKQKWQAEARKFQVSAKKYTKQIEKIESELKILKLELLDLEEQKEKETKRFEKKIKTQKEEFELQKKDLKNQALKKNSLAQLIAHLQERLFYFSVTAPKENILINGPSDRSILNDANYLTGKRLMQQKKYPAALAIFRKVVKQHPNSRWSYSALSRALYRNGKIGEARKEFYGFLRILKTDFIRKEKLKK